MMMRSKHSITGIMILINKTFLLITFLLLNSCNIASVLTGAETDLGDNFATDVRDGLVFFYRLEENATTRADETGAYPLTDNVSVNNTSGAVGNAADCFGAASASPFLRNTSPAFSLSATEDYSFAFWFNDQDGAGGGQILDIDQLQVQINGGGGILEVSTDAGATQHASAFGYSTNTWYHYAFVADAANDEIDMYVDGTFYETLSVLDSGIAPSNITVCSDGAGDKAPGYIDNIGFWRRRLSGNEIKALARGSTNVD